MTHELNSKTQLLLSQSLHDGIFIYVCMVCVCECLCVCVYIYTYINTQHTHTRMHARARARAHTHTHTHTKQYSQKGSDGLLEGLGAFKSTLAVTREEKKKGEFSSANYLDCLCSCDELDEFSLVY